MRGDVRKTNGCGGGGAGGEGGRAGPGGGLPVDAGKKKGCKLILESPRRGILVKRVCAGILPSCWDRCEVSVISTELRLLCFSTSAEKPLISSSSSGAGADFRWLSSENSFVLAQRLQLLLRWALCFASSPRAALGWSSETALSPANRQTLLWRGPGMIPPSLLILLLGARSCRVLGPQAGTGSCAPCQRCRESCCGRGCCWGKRGTGRWQGKPEGFCK